MRAYLEQWVIRKIVIDCEDGEVEGDEGGGGCWDGGSDGDGGRKLCDGR